VAINLDWRVTGPIWHKLIGASLQFASCDLSLLRSLIPVGTFLFVSAAARSPYAPIMIIVFLVPLLYILVLARH
jgi:hypothetical protein